jgi:hypothetical protein
MSSLIGREEKCGTDTYPSLKIIKLPINNEFEDCHFYDLCILQVSLVYFQGKLLVPSVLCCHSSLYSSRNLLIPASIIVNPNFSPSEPKCICSLFGTIRRLDRDVIQLIRFLTSHATHFYIIRMNIEQLRFH